MLSRSSLGASISVHAGVLIAATMQLPPEPKLVQRTPVAIRIQDQAPPPMSPKAPHARSHKVIHAKPISTKTQAPPTRPIEAPAALAPVAQAAENAQSDASIATFASAAPAAVATQAAAPAQPYSEGRVDVPARATQPIQPTYPFAARASGKEATVELEIVLSKEGQVESVQVNNHPGIGFEQAAIKAVRAARFSPAQKEGVAVPVRMAWRVEFRLQ